MWKDVVDCVWNVMAHAQKPDFVFRRNGRVHLNRRGRQFSRLLAAEVCASAILMLDTPCSEVVWSVLATHSIRQFPLHFPSCASPCAITFQLDSRTRRVTADNIVRRVRFACWITKATNGHSVYVVRIVFPRQLWLRERGSMLRLNVIGGRVIFQ